MWSVRRETGSREHHQGRPRERRFDKRVVFSEKNLAAVLSASASYIVLPAVIRYAIPEARPSRYFTMSLAITFPFNGLVGIPLYYAIACRLWE